jgi:hypothetical protein
MKVQRESEIQKERLVAVSRKTLEDTVLWNRKLQFVRILQQGGSSPANNDMVRSMWRYIYLYTYTYTHVHIWYLFLVLLCTVGWSFVFHVYMFFDLLCILCRWVYNTHYLYTTLLFVTPQFASRSGKNSSAK